MLINKKYVQEFLTKDAPWSESHFAIDDYLGCGLLYYSLAYSKMAKVCVCLGSGGGFVPRIMKQAQRDLGLSNGRTILVDGDMGDWGRPAWRNPDSFFLTHFPDIEIIISTTKNVAENWDKNVKIDYLHIDADHSYKASMDDFFGYLPFMSINGVVTFHDTCGRAPSGEAAEDIKRLGFEIVNFKEFGAGVALIHLNPEES